MLDLFMIIIETPSPHPPLWALLGRDEGARARSPEGEVITDSKNYINFVNERDRPSFLPKDISPEA
jgi:hypothetical protein